MKNILLISYSQTGQLNQLVQSFISPIESCSPQIQIDHIQLNPQHPYPFPWKFIHFFNTFPETVHLQPTKIEPISLKYPHYDLVIIAYSVWFLSPSQPITAFMQSEIAKTILHNTPVITLIGCRNMWLIAQEKMKEMIQLSGGKLIGNIVKIDQCSSAASFITTPLWLLTGKKQAIKWLPEAGIAPSQINDMAYFGERLKQILLNHNLLNHKLFQHMGAAYVNERLITSEHIAYRSFKIWGKLLIKLGHISYYLRLTILWFYIIFLVIMILTIVPISATIKYLTAPLFNRHIKKQKTYYGKPSGWW